MSTRKRKKMLNGPEHPLAEGEVVSAVRRSRGRDGEYRAGAGHGVQWVLLNSSQLREQLAEQPSRAVSLPSWPAELSGRAAGNDWLCEWSLVICSSAAVTGAGRSHEPAFLFWVHPTALTLTAG